VSELSLFGMQMSSDLCVVRVSNFLEQVDCHHHEPRALSITIQAMVYGNLNSDSGSGVAFSRNPDGSTSTPVGEYLSKAEGKEVLEGDRPATCMEV
jgi:phosphoenolpyruvate synthase/pyruvate phosphate dikinase